MNERAIELANAESSLTRWIEYTNAARAAEDAKKIAYGEARIEGAKTRLRKLRAA